MTCLFRHIFNCILSFASMAPDSSTLAWKIPWMEEPGGLQSMASLRVGHDWATSLSLFTFYFHALEKEMATRSSVLAWRIPGMGEPGGLPSMGSHRVGHDWSDLAAAPLPPTFKNQLITPLFLKTPNPCLGSAFQLSSTSVFSHPFTTEIFKNFHLLFPFPIYSSAAPLTRQHRHETPVASLQPKPGAGFLYDVFSLTISKFSCFCF